jgi:predicted short-subunit dehydrogenase-like oxidoreductase (DUF2520 family)
VASSLRLASRYANALKAGRAARVEELAECGMVLIQAPAEKAPEMLGLLLGVEDWRGKVVVLLSEDLDVAALEAMKARGAAVCAAALAPGPGTPVLVAEGDAAAVRAVREWGRAAKIRLVELNEGTKLMYGAALTSANTLILPVLEAAQRSLRGAGLSLPDARRIVAYLAAGAVRAHKAHGRKAWRNPGLPGRRAAVRAQLAALEGLDGRLAKFQASGLRAALGLFGQPGEWLGDDKRVESGDAKAAGGIY